MFLTIRFGCTNLHSRLFWGSFFPIDYHCCWIFKLKRVLFEYYLNIQIQKSDSTKHKWQFWPPIFKASATPECSVLFMHSLFFPFCGKLGLESSINPRVYSDVTYMPVYMYRPCSTFFLKTWRFRVIMIAHSLIAHSPIRSALCVQTPLSFF